MKSSEIFAASMTPHVKKTLASKFSVSEKTVAAWCHPKESDLEPTGTGKNNPLDQAARAIRVLHRYDPPSARAAVLYLQNVLDELNEESGRNGFESHEHRCQQLAKVISEHADLATEMITHHDDGRALKEALELASANDQLISCLRAEIQVRAN